MQKEDLIIEILRQMQSEVIAFKQEVNTRFNDSQIEAREFRKEIREDLRDFKAEVRDDAKQTRDLIKAETVRIDEVYGERKKVEVSWTRMFLLQNATVSAFVAFFVSLFSKS